MKHLVYFALSFLTLNAFSQSLTCDTPVVRLIDYTIDCHQGMIQCTFLDTCAPTDGVLYLLKDSAGQWTYVQNSAVQTVGAVDTFDFIFSGIGQDMHDYDSMTIVYYHQPTLDTFYILYFGIHCGTTGIETTTPNWVIINRKYYTLTGQPVNDFFTTGIYIEVITYENYRQSMRKVYK